MRPALLQERGIKMTTTNRTSRTRRKRNTGTLNVKINACQECGNKKPRLKVDKNFFISSRAGYPDLLGRGGMPAPSFQ